MSVDTTRSDETVHDDFYAELADNHYSPLWQLMGNLGPEAKTTLVPHIWRYEQARR